MTDGGVISRWNLNSYSEEWRQRVGRNSKSLIICFVLELHRSATWFTPSGKSHPTVHGSVIHWRDPDRLDRRLHSLPWWQKWRKKYTFKLESLLNNLVWEINGAHRDGVSALNVAQGKILSGGMVCWQMIAWIYHCTASVRYLFLLLIFPFLLSYLTIKDGTIRVWSLKDRRMTAQVRNGFLHLCLVAIVSFPNFVALILKYF